MVPKVERAILDSNEFPMVANVQTNTREPLGSLLYKQELQIPFESLLPTQDSMTLCIKPVVNWLQHSK